MVGRDVDVAGDVVVDVVAGFAWCVAGTVEGFEFSCGWVYGEEWVCVAVLYEVDIVD